MLVNRNLYPVDLAFVSLLPVEQRNRIIELGFSHTDAVFFEIPFCAISGVGSGILRDYSRKCFYPFFCSTQGVVEKLPEPYLRVVAEHEQHETTEAIAQASDAGQKSGLTTLAEEAERHVPEIEKLARKYGRDTVTGTITEVGRIASAYPVVPRYIVLYWLTAFVVLHAGSVSACARPMPAIMLSEAQRACHRQVLDKVLNEYAQPPKGFAELHRATVRS